MLNIPILGFAAYSGTGKTTLLLKLLPLLKAKGLRIAMLKHTHHDFDIDKPGKDSYRLREAGAEQMLVASSQRFALMVETGNYDEPCLAELLPKLDQKNLDLILVEGFKHEKIPKIELHRPSLGKDFLFTNDKDIIAIASDESLLQVKIPVLNLHNPQQIVDFIMLNILN
jgi:molybdopterin-guanine dinucleotide biosynthesis protein MobB